MALVKYIDAQGVETEVDVVNGDTVMEGATANGIEGIVAECGGGCACATCHCYVDEAWYDRLAPPGDAERDLLECVSEPRPTSRLSCQIHVSDELDGLLVRLPESQY
jgi:2Fe-2S ferredoxin